MFKLEVFRDDELYLIERSGTYYIYGMHDGRRVRKSCRTRNLSKAKWLLESLKREHAMDWGCDYDDPNRDWKGVAKLICERHEAGARKRGIPFDLKATDVFNLMISMDFRCAVSGIPLSKRLVLGGARDPWAPSIDRIECRHGYTLDNVRVVTLAANLAMNEWGRDALLRLARGVVRNADFSQEPQKVEHSVTQCDKNSAQVIDIFTQSKK